VSPIVILGSWSIGLTYAASRAEALDVSIAVGGELLDGGVERVHRRSLKQKGAGVHPWMAAHLGFVLVLIVDTLNTFAAMTNQHFGNGVRDTRRAIPERRSGESRPVTMKI
jgi:hypothetical protein